MAGRTTMPSSRIAIVLALTIAAIAAGCGQPEPTDPVVAVVGDRTLTLSQFDVYLEANVSPDAFEEPVGQGDTARVKSGLFDDFVNEALLLEEAEARGLEPTEHEIETWLAAGDEEPRATPQENAARRARARVDVTVQKLLESELAAGVGDTEERAEPVGALLARLRARTRIELHTDRLPFPYVPSTSPPPEEER